MYDRRPMILRALSCVLALAACGPGSPSPGATTSGAASTGETGTTTTGVTSSSGASDPTTGSSMSSTTPATSTAASTATSSTSSATSSTGGLGECSWYWPEFQDLVFCPAPGAGTEISGTSPLGPVNFQFALFGLQTCGCPSPIMPSLWLYSEPPGADPEQPPGDFMRLYVYQGNVTGAKASVAGMWMNLEPEVKMVVELSAEPTFEETSPPLDEGAPPVFAGTLTLHGGGWDVAGGFTATLCNELDWSIPCE